jgi:hypothetical protein
MLLLGSVGLKVLTILYITITLFLPLVEVRLLSTILFLDPPLHNPYIQFISKLYKHSILYWILN